MRANTLLDERGLHRHVVRFFPDEDALAHCVASHLGEALSAGGTAIALVAPEHRLACETALSSLDLGPIDDDRLQLLDAKEVADAVLVHGCVDPFRFEETVGKLVGDATSARGPVHVYGEVVALLWDAGQVNAVLELEALWNDLLDREGFSLLCGYEQQVGATGAGSAALEEVCRLHSAVVGQIGSDAPGGARQVSRLFASDVNGPGLARTFVKETMRQWGRPNVEDAVLVASELCTNAVLHARSDFAITISSSEDGVRVSVRDCVPLGEDREILPVRESHGLDIVSKLTRRWGVERLTGAKVVWAEIADEVDQ